MKKLAILLTAAILAGSLASCSADDNSDSVTTTAPATETVPVSDTAEVTSHTETTEAAPVAETSEVTSSAETESSEDEAEYGRLSSSEIPTEEEAREIFNYYAEDLTVKRLAYSEFEAFLDSLPKDKEYEDIVVEVADAPGLYLWVGNYSFNPEVYRVSFVYYNGKVEVNSLDFVFDDRRFVVLKTDDLVAIGVTGDETEYYIYNSAGYRHLGPNCGRDGSIIELYVEDGDLHYRMENPIITHGKDDPSVILENVLSSDTWKEEWGVIDSDLSFCKAGESTVTDEGYLSSLLPYNGIDNADDLFKRNNAKYDIDLPEIELLPQHQGLPVYLINSDLTVPGENTDNDLYFSVSRHYSDTGFFHKEYVVAFRDNPELAFVFRTYLYIDNINLPELRSTMKYVYFNGGEFDPSSYSIGDFGFDLVCTDDIIAVIGGAPCGEGQKFLLSKNGIYDCSIENETGLNFHYRISVTDEGVMEITMTPVAIAHIQSIGWCLNFESDDVYSIKAVASVTDDGVTLTETERMTLGEFFESDESAYMKGDSGAATFDEYKEYVRDLLYR